LVSQKVKTQGHDFGIGVSIWGNQQNEAAHCQYQSSVLLSFYPAKVTTYRHFGV
jgi:hypothetical protein